MCGYVLQCVGVCWSVLECVAVRSHFRYPCVLHCVAVRCSVLQCVAPQYNSLQHNATHYNTLQCTSTPCNARNTPTTHQRHTQHQDLTKIKGPKSHCSTLQQINITYTARITNIQRTVTLQHIATHCNTLQHTATHINAIHTAKI